MEKKRKNTDDSRYGVAAARFAVVSRVKAKKAGGMSLSQAILRMGKCRYIDTKDKLRRVSSRTIHRWMKGFNEKNIEGLCNQPHQMKGVSRVLSEKFIEYLKEQKKEDPEASVPEIIQRALFANIISKNENISRVTVYRACLTLNLPLMQKRSVKYKDMMRFSYDHRMIMVICDGNHFRAGASRRKRVAFFFLDDASRLGLHVVVGTSETAVLFLRGLYEVIGRFGLMKIMYFDLGPGFIANDVATIAASLGISIVHGEAHYPEGRGKIERFNRTVNADLLRSLDGNPEIDPDCKALELRLQHYLKDVYNLRKHESLKPDSPFSRFSNDTKELRFPKSDQELRSFFVVKEDRKVSKDNIISVDGISYEMPSGYAWTWVSAHRRVLDGTIAVLHEGKLIDLHPVNLEENARSKREQRKKEPPPTETPPSKTAATMAFDKDFSPIVGPDGNFFKDKTKKEEEPL